MRLFELFEAKAEKKKVDALPPRNFVAKYAKKSGGGTHAPSDAEKIKKGNFRKLKHKNRDLDETE